ncbi:MAG: dihydroorotate dehydrogenase electron transfer subunit [Planctomycetota bacterium]|nr:MAG: dihydroorotate dehydrogenase electron transfer subunit [Planctomycetota bacterium]
MVPTAVECTGRVVEQAPLARDTFRLRLECPEIAEQIVPGQFFMIRIPGGSDPLLGRPFALYDVARDADGRAVAIDFVYHVIGKVTGLLAGWSGGERVELWGPLGNGFPVPRAGHLVCVGGGIGYTPFLAVAREAAGQRRYGNPGRAVAETASRVTLLYGVQTRDVRAELSDFADIPRFSHRISTDDGSEGRAGFVTELLREMLTDETERPAAVYCCGPEPMMRATAALCAEHEAPCWLSLETPMACGFGACFSCVTRVRVDEDPGWDYRRTCVEGPVFSSASLLLE